MTKDKDYFRLVEFKFDAIWSTLYGEVSTDTLKDVVQQYADRHELTVIPYGDGSSFTIVTDPAKGWEAREAIGHGYYFYE